MDGTIFGEQSGSAPAAVLALHGWGRSHRDFAAALGLSRTRKEGDAVPQEWDGLAVDLPGFGASPPPLTAWSTAEYAESLSPLLQQLQERPVLVGHSFGGLVALRLAKAYPERIGALVLTGAPVLRIGARSKVHPAYRMSRLMSRMHLIGPAKLEAARRRYGSSDYRNAAGVMREILVKRLAEDFESDLCSVKLPVTLVWGERDTVVPVAVAERACELLVDARLVVVPDVGHLLPVESPGALREAIVHRLS